MMIASPSQDSDWTLPTQACTMGDSRRTVGLATGCYTWGTVIKLPAISLPRPGETRRDNDDNACVSVWTACPPSASILFAQVSQLTSPAGRRAGGQVQQQSYLTTCFVLPAILLTSTHLIRWLGLMFRLSQSFSIHKPGFLRPSMWATRTLKARRTESSR